MGIRPAKKKKITKVSARRGSISGRTLSFDLNPKHDGLTSIFGAAYLMMDRAYVFLEGDKSKSLRVILKSKENSNLSTLEELRETFLAELESQKIRWAIAEANLPLREYLVENAVSLAQGRQEVSNPTQTAPEELTDQQRLEIERLIAEVETEIKEMNDRKSNPEARHLSSSWEAQQGAQEPKG